ncbi:prolyl-tRNA synthetase associated domain-containing protein [Crenalkalicoccus roseus]|uniref:prolyl-tRNA synthetase associated domain-containing protein n=1 Tax=Crenalkalicoccus roseus TaxID=1485588 RepID=UPI00108178AC|nr:prolyl-tRNA synthetase associated domain-containing protein [Crenalkalicoccus roseus]
MHRHLPETGSVPPARPGPETPEGLLARLAAMGIEARTTTHPPVFTVAESRALRGRLEGGHSKNLFLQPRSGPFLLVVLEEGRQVSVNALARRLGAGRASFAPAEALMAELGVAPGSVTPFGLVNAAPGAVRAVFDRHLMEAFEWVHFHPLTNAATTAIRPGDLLRFLCALGHAPEVVDLGPPGGG